MGLKHFGINIIWLFLIAGVIDPILHQVSPLYTILNRVCGGVLIVKKNFHWILLV
jgi:hypothetical protein